MLKKKKIYPAYVSKHNSNCEKQVFLLMIQSKEELWYYLAVKELSALLKGIPSKYYGHFYCLNCLLELHKYVYENKGFSM